MQQVHSRDDLVAHSLKLKQLFNDLVNVLINLEGLRVTHPEAEQRMQGKKEAISDQLRIELNRVLHMEGGREIIEKTQEDALNRLDVFQRNKKQDPHFQIMP